MTKKKKVDKPTVKTKAMKIETETIRTFDVVCPSCNTKNSVINKYGKKLIIKLPGNKLIFPIDVGAIPCCSCGKPVPIDR